MTARVPQRADLHVFFGKLAHLEFCVVESGDTPNLQGKASQQESIVCDHASS